MEKKNYDCSVHGGDGEVDCEECKRNLRRLAKDNNAVIVGDF